jgi:nitrogen regulatory protein PII
MKKIEMIVGRDSLHYVIERLSLLKAVKNVHVTSSELVNLYSNEEHKSMISTRVEFVIDDEYVDEVIQLILGDEKVSFGKLYVITIDRVFELGYREGHRFKLALSSLIRVPRRYVFDIITNYEKLRDLLPAYYKSMYVRSSSDNVVVTEDEFILLDIVCKQISRHTLYPPAVHEVEILSGYLEGSRITETYTEMDDNTYMMLVADMKVKENLIELIGFHIKHRLEQYMKAFLKELTRVIENEYNNNNNNY